MKLNLNSNRISAYTLDSACSLHSDCTSAYCRWLLSPQTPITFHHQISTFKDFVTKMYKETHSYYVLIILIMYLPWSSQSPLSWSPCRWRWWRWWWQPRWRWWPGTGCAHAREEQRGKPRTTERYTALWYKPSSQLSCLQCNGYGDNGHDENGYLWRIGEPCLSRDCVSDDDGCNAQVRKEAAEYQVPTAVSFATRPILDLFQFQFSC